MLLHYLYVCFAEEYLYLLSIYFQIFMFSQIQAWFYSRNVFF